MTRVLPAAALRVGDVVRLDGLDITIERVHNADPEPGRIRWETDAGDVPIGAAERVDVVRLA